MYLLNKLVGVAEGHQTGLVQAQLLLEQSLGDTLESVTQVAHNEPTDRINKTNIVHQYREIISIS